MEMPELDKKIKRAILCKANEIIPSEDTFTLILAGLEKKQATRTFNTSYKHYIIALICAISVIVGATLALSVDVNSSAIQLISTVKTVSTMDSSNQVIERNAGVVSKQTVNDLELYLKLLIIGRMTLAQTWYDSRFCHTQVPIY